MCSTKQCALTLGPLVLLLGCSSHPASNGADAKEATGDVGKSKDTLASEAGDARKSDGGVLDTRVSDTSVSEAGAHPDTKDAAKASDSKDVRPAIDGANAAIDATDGSAVTVPDAPVHYAGTCDSPIPIPWETMRTNIVTTNVGATHQMDIPCAANGGDVVFSITNTNPQLVSADTFGATWNTILYFSDTCPPDTSGTVSQDGLPVCNDDACGTSQSQATALLSYGTHYLILSGANGESGDVTIHFDRTMVGDGLLLPFPAGAGSLPGTTSGAGGPSFGLPG